MPNKTLIEWTRSYSPDRSKFFSGYTSNPIKFEDKRNGSFGWFCPKFDESCRDCYAESINRRFGTGTDFDSKLSKFMQPVLVQKEFENLYELNHKLGKENLNRKVFIGDMFDLFQPKIPLNYHSDLWRMISRCKNLTFQVLTKVPTQLVKSLQLHFGNENQNDFIKLPKNLWLGFSACDQQKFDARWRIMKNLRKPFFDASVIFCSYEPALDELVLPDDFLSLKKHGWLIAGGESGNRRRVRPSDPDWFRKIQKQCKKAKLPFFFKQWGSRLPVSQISNNPSHEGRFHPLSDVLENGEMIYKVFKSYTERRLDGVEYNEFPLSGL